MNENIDLSKILKDCPRGTKLYSKVHGEVVFAYISVAPENPIVVIAKTKDNKPFYQAFNNNGHLYSSPNDGECILVPSKDQQDWSKFTATWVKIITKKKFDPITLQPFDKVLVRDVHSQIWRCDFLSYIKYGNVDYPYVAISDIYKFCIPYNDDTKHLAGTTKQAPEFYRYWEE